MNGLNELILATIFGRRRGPFFVPDVNTNIRQHLRSPQASLCRAANAFQVVWYERVRRLRHGNTLTENRLGKESNENNRYISCFGI